MKELYKEYFHIPKHGKIREKVMLMRVITTVVIMVVCLATMSITAYAYFSYNVTSGSNIIKSANFETNVRVQINDANGEAVTVNTSNYKSHWAELTANTTYYITLEHTERSTAKTGFVIITAENCDSKYHTQQLGKDGNGITETITFYIKPNANTKVTFLAHWGTSSYYGYQSENNELYIINGETVKMAITGGSSTEQTTDTTEQSTSTTESTTTQPSETTATESTEPQAIE